MDPEVLDSTSTEDGKQRGLYYIPSSQGRSPESAGEFVDSIFEVSFVITAYHQGQHHHVMSETVNSSLQVASTTSPAAGFALQSQRTILA